MKLTEVHAKFWQERKATPGWVQRMRAESNVHPRFARRDTSVDACVNAHVGIRFKDNDAHNLIVLIRRYKGQELRDTLQRLAIAPGTVINPKRRAGYAAKWLAKLNGQRRPKTPLKPHPVLGIALALVSALDAAK